MYETYFPVNDLFRRKLQTSLTIISLTCSVASTLFLLQFAERTNLGIISTSISGDTLTHGLLVVFSQFSRFIGFLIFAVGAVTTSFMVFLMMNQRTRDFGLIKAAGCPNSLVFGYFMTELLLMTLTGCLLGIVLGFGADLAVANLSSFQAYQNSPNFWFALIVFVFFFLLAIVFGTKPILNAARLSPMETLSPMHYFGLTTGVKLKALSRSRLITRIATRSLFRRKSVTIRAVLLLSIVFILLTVSIAGSIIASNTSTSWVESAIGRNIIVLAHERMTAQYELLLSKFSGAKESGNFDYSDESLAISDVIIQQLKVMPEIVSVDPRLILKEHVYEMSNFTIDPETLATIPIGDKREGDSIIVGIDPKQATGTWYTQGRFLEANDEWEAVIGEPIAQTIFSQPLVQRIKIREQPFIIRGICFDPLNNGKITYVPIKKLQNIVNSSDQNIVFLKLDTSVDRGNVLTQVRDRVINMHPELTVFELDDVLKKDLNFLNSAWSTIMLLPLLTLASAGLCLVAYVMLVVDEERQEFAILRATGAKPRTIVDIVAVQSGIVLLSSFGVGLSFGVITTLIVLIPNPVVTSLTILEIAEWLFAALTGIFLLSLIPAFKLARASILKIMS